MANVLSWSDIKLKFIEKKISDIYSQSSKEMIDKWNKYMEDADKRLSNLWDEFNKANASGDVKWMLEAGEKYLNAEKNITLRNKQYKEMVDSVTKDMAEINQMAVEYMNGQMPDIYVHSYHEINDDLSNLGISFSLPNESAIKRRIMDGDIKLPKKKLQVPKDKQWNTKKLNSAVLQGIIQGESMPDIAKRILPIVDNNKQAAIRNARTMVNGAENQGRLDSYEKLAEHGVVIKKVWIATGDDRTREWHLEMDGQEVDLDEPFVDGNGNEIMYPADPDAEPETVYNCRCAMKSHVIGFRNSDGTISYVNFDKGAEFSRPEKEILNEWNKRLNGKDDEDKFDVEKELDESLEDIDFLDVGKINEDELPLIIDDSDLDTGDSFVEEKIKELNENEKDVEENVSEINLDNFIAWDKNKIRTENSRMNITQEESDIIYDWENGYIATGNSFDINHSLRYDDEDYINSSSKHTIEVLQNVIDKNTLNDDSRFVRMVGEDYMKNMLDISYDDLYDIIDNFLDVEPYLNDLIGTTITEKGFMSVSSNIDNNVFTDRPVVLDIYAKEGTNIYVTNNFYESESIFGLNTQYDILGFGIRRNPWGKEQLIIKALIKK